MATRKALVLIGGEPGELPVGDTLAGPVAEVNLIGLTNGDSGAHVLGDVVYISAADTVRKARADAVGTKDAFALAAQGVNAAAVGNYQTDGVLGGMTGLTPGAVYYLSPTTAGAITTTAPSASGQYVVRIGIAVSATEMAIDIQRPMLRS